MSMSRQVGLFMSDIALESGGACRRARPSRAGSVTHSPESQLFELRAGRGGPTYAGPAGPHPAPPARLRSVSLMNSPTWRLIHIGGSGLERRKYD